MNNLLYLYTKQNLEKIVPKKKIICPSDVFLNQHCYQ